MERVNSIIRHPKYGESYNLLQESEKERRFCGHSMSHFLDVARLMYIFALEEGLQIEKEIIYATALLHDLGRCREYKDGTQHHKASAQLAAQILPACDFTSEEQRQIINAILTHRTSDAGDSFSKLFYKADKMSRDCQFCSVRTDCCWPEEKKNLKISY